jgi:hypothetical protein
MGEKRNTGRPAAADETHGVAGAGKGLTVEGAQMANADTAPPNDDKPDSGRTRTILEVIVAGITIVSALAAGFFWVDSRYAPMLSHKTLEHRFEVKTVNDYISTSAKILR